MAAAAHSGSAVSVEVGLALLLKVGSRGLEVDRGQRGGGQTGSDTVKRKQPKNESSLS